MRTQDRDVGNAAEIQDHAGVGCGENPCMKNRNKRSTLTTCGDIPTTKVGNDAYASAFSQACGRVELNRKAKIGSVTNGLSVCTQG